MYFDLVYSQYDAHIQYLIVWKNINPMEFINRSIECIHCDSDIPVNLGRRLFPLNT